VVKVPPPEALNYHFAQGDFFPLAGADNWMGKQIRVTAHGQPATLTLRGNGFTPAQITLDSAGQNSISTIGPNATIILQLPANTVLTITADQTYVPNKFLHNHDHRHISVIFSLQ